MLRRVTEVARREACVRGPYRPSGALFDAAVRASSPVTVGRWCTWGKRSLAVRSSSLVCDVSRSDTVSKQGENVEGSLDQRVWSEADLPQLRSELAPVILLSERTKALAVGVLNGDRTALSRAITLVESSRKDHRDQAEALLDTVLQARQLGSRDAAGDEPKGSSEAGVSGPSTFRVGIAGPPGAGKSTFIEALGLQLVEKGHRVAVVAVDPSSTRYGGSILGDVTRMTHLSRHPQAFVRPSPTRGTLGGLAEHTNDVVLLCEGAGHDIVLLETVGLGQSEVLIDETCDMLLLVVPPAGGDELQGVKKGIMEVADMVVVNKADGELMVSARHSAADFRRALQLVRPKYEWWTPKVKRCSALTNDGVDRVWQTVLEFREESDAGGYTMRKRARQRTRWMWEQLSAQLNDFARRHAGVAAEASRLESPLTEGFVSPRGAAKHLLRTLLGKGSE